MTDLRGHSDRNSPLTSGAELAIRGARPNGKQIALLKNFIEAYGIIKCTCNHVASSCICVSIPVAFRGDDSCLVTDMSTRECVEVAGSLGAGLAR
jgi:hypothetical protein